MSGDLTEQGNLRYHVKGKYKRRTCKANTEDNAGADSVVVVMMVCESRLERRVEPD